MQVRNTGNADGGKSAEIQSPTVIPEPEAFKSWVQDSLAVLDVSAGRVSREMGVGRNTVGDFLSIKGRGITLSTAHVLTCKLREIAQDRQKVLPRLMSRTATQVKGGA